jgi:hypothetical protein
MATIKSIKEKAKAYDEAIKVAKSKIKNDKDHVLYEDDVTEIFPELKESKDEKIIKALYKMAKVPRKEIYEAEGITKEQALDWLEKQDKCETDCHHSHQDVNYPKGGIVMEDFNEGNGFYKVNLAYLNEEQVKEIEGLVKKWNTELKESEDERIRKELVQFFEEKDEEDFEEWIPKAKVLAWLEKQGKQKETLCDKCKKTQPYHSCQDITALGRCALEKQGELELTEFERAVKQVMEEAIECGDTRNLKADAEMLLSLIHKSAWSEEDEKLLDKVIKRLHKYSAKDEEYLDKYYWLIELKHRVQPQNTWKPSDEQIKVLVEVLIFAANNESPHWQDYIFGILKNLTRQLKKLREE